MKSVSKQALVPYSPAEVYALVNDVAAYPQFLPWCSGARVLQVDDDEVRATIEMQRGGLRRSFSTRNRLQKDKMIEVRLLEGPFRHLEGYWRFDPLGQDGCKISFDLQFEFSSRLVSATLGPVFQQIARTLVDAFCRRAVEVYGKR
ncbi:MAG TPA: type II toxin-antitoxin system RatA family toxin [Gammaproteobacteria bacterium]